MLARAEVAGAGFINLHLVRDAHSAELRRILERAEHYGESDAGRGERVLLEFVSATRPGRCMWATAARRPTVQVSAICCA